LLEVMMLIDCIKMQEAVDAIYSIEDRRID
jgi:hypothetical protein